jgi:ATP-dependent Lon protease
MFTALASAFTKQPVNERLAMSGEITLRGRILPVGGVKEKILAAKRARITDIILSKENKRDISEIKSDYIKGIRFHYLADMIDVLDLALLKKK